MNGRIQDEETPEGRLAAVAHSLAIQMQKCFAEKCFGPSQPDFADYREALRPFVKRELIMVRIDEARKVSGRVLTERIRELAAELMEVNRTLPGGFPL
jgi:hypothetical protein